MTFTHLSTDADALIPASKSPEFDVTVASNAAADSIEVCVRYSTSRFSP